MMPPSDSASRAAILGRERECELLRHQLERAIAGSGSLVLIGGEAGIGKTTLVRSLMREAGERGCLVLAGACYDLTTTPPYGPWAEIARHYPDDNDLPSIPSQLRAADELSGIDSQAALFELVGRFLKSVAACLPVVLQLEDVHWADAASLDLLRYVARSLESSRLLLVVTYRHDEIIGDRLLAPLLLPLVRESNAHRIDLQRLDNAAVLEIVRQRYLLDGGDEARLLDYLYRLAEGNPFFTHELLYALEFQRRLTLVDGGWVLGDLRYAGVPLLLRHVIDRRLARLDEGARSLLDVATVIGHEAPLDLLVDVVPDTIEQIDNALQQASEHHVLRDNAKQRSVQFTHALVRQAVYEGIPTLRRQRLHLRVGDVLARQQRPDAATVARHFHSAGNERALEWFERAAEQAQQLFAPGSVIEYAQQGIDLAGRLGVDESLALYRMRGLARESIGDFDGARADHEAILAQASVRGGRRAEWQAMLDLAALWASRDYQRTRIYCEQAVGLAREMNAPDALAHSLNRLGNWHLNADDPGAAIRHHDEALRLFESIDDRQGIASTLDLAAISHYMAGNSGQAILLWERAIPILRQLDDRQNLCSALTNATSAPRGGYGYRSSRVLRHPVSIGRNSADTVTAAIRIARSIDSRGHECFALGVLGQNAVTLGDVRSGLQSMSEALVIAEDIEHVQWSALIRVCLGASYVDLLIADRASELLHGALDRATQSGATFQAACATGFLASAHVLLGDYDRAERLLDGLVHPDRPPATMSARLCWFAAAELALERGNPMDALTIIDTLIDSVPHGSGELTPYLTRLHGEILLAYGRLDDADRELGNAHDVATRLDYPLARWRILATQRKLALMTGQHDEAMRTEAAARDVINGLAAQLDDAEMRQTFLTNAVAQLLSPPPAVAPRSTTNLAGLTAREIEVLCLVAEGLSNRAIADRLYLSVRTVERHITNIYGKADLHNRFEATAFVRHHNLAPPNLTTT